MPQQVNDKNKKKKKQRQTIFKEENDGRDDFMSKLTKKSPIILKEKEIIKGEKTRVFKEKFNFLNMS